MSAIASRANPRVRRWRALLRDARARRQERRAVIEGEHLVTACLDAGRSIETLLVAKSAEQQFRNLGQRVGSVAVLSDPVFKAIADTESPGGIAAEISIPAPDPDLDAAASCVFLEGVQDAGNVGTILRSAAAFGIRHAVLGPGCADAWSPKVLRAGMGAHFALAIMERTDLAAAVAEFGGKTICTVPRDGVALASADLQGRIGWLLGAEGRGVSESLAARATLRVTIPMPGGTESLNVAAAAAICFYEATRGI